MTHESAPRAAGEVGHANDSQDVRVAGEPVPATADAAPTDEPPTVRPGVDDSIRFHVDPRGRILIENFTCACLELARALAPQDPMIRKLMHSVDLSGERRTHAEKRS